MQIGDRTAALLRGEWLLKTGSYKIEFGGFLKICN